MGFAERLSFDLQKYDRDLVCLQTEAGRRSIWRNYHRWQTFDWDTGSILRIKFPEKQLVFHLTDTWSIRGTPVEWGLLPILNRLRCIDIYNNHTWFEQIAAQNEKVEESKRRDFSNTVEAFMYDFRDDVKKSTNDIVVKADQRF